MTLVELLRSSRLWRRIQSSLNRADTRPVKRVLSQCAPRRTAGGTEGTAMAHVQARDFFDLERSTETLREAITGLIENSRVEFPEGLTAPTQPTPFDPCHLPAADTEPSFTILYRRPVLIAQAGVPEFFPLACLPISRMRVYLGLDLRFAQRWNLTKVGIADLASTMSLAPAERVVLEFRSTQRRRL